MSKKRVIACLVVRDGHVVQSRGFKHYLPVGRPEISARFLSEWGADEIVLLDITATQEGRLIDPAMVERVAQSVFVPLMVGGGIRSVNDVRTVIQAGADKIIVNSLSLDSLDAVSEAVAHFGRQCIIASIDARQTEDNYRVFGCSGRVATAWTPAAHAARVEAAGAGEILLNSIDRDGARGGYDLALVDHVTAAVRIPIIAIGGAGTPVHIHDVLSRPGVSAAAAANFFHYSEHAVTTTKCYLRAHRIDVRLDSWADYSRFGFEEESGLILKRDEAELVDEVFEYIREEVI